MKFLSVLSLVISVVALTLVVRTPSSPSPTQAQAPSTHELVNTRERLRASDEKLANMATRLAEVEQRYEALAKSDKAVVSSPRLPLLIGGSYTIEQNAVVYESDAKLSLDDKTIHSPTGVMVSDLEQRTIVGDLAMETEHGTFHADGAVLDVAKGTLKSSRVRFSSKKAFETTAPEASP